MPKADVPFGDEPAEPEPAATIAIPINATVLQYADAVSPDEQWDTCCVCGCAGDCEGCRFDALTRGLLLLADGTLGRAAWCMKLACSDERYASTYIPWRETE